MKKPIYIISNGHLLDPDTPWFVEGDMFTSEWEDCAVEFKLSPDRKTIFLVAPRNHHLAKQVLKDMYELADRAYSLLTPTGEELIIATESLAQAQFPQLFPKKLKI